MNVECLLLLLVSSFIMCLCEKPFLGKKQLLTYKKGFISLSKTTPFVDKTMFIKYVFQGRPFKLITTPQKFGKTTNLDMLETFLSVPVDSKGKVINKRLTENYKTFSKLNIYKRERTFFHEYFGMFPVLKVGFKTKSVVTNRSDAIEIVRNKIHKSFQKYEYLKNSKKLNSEENSLVQLWSSEVGYKNMDEEDVNVGLLYLAKCLFKHFDCTEVFVIVDDYDSPIAAVPSSAGEQELRSVTGVVLGQLEKLRSSPHVGGVLVAGVSALPSFGLSSGNDIARYTFLGDHPFAEYFGLTDDEFSALVHDGTLNALPLEIRRARQIYGGYLSKGGKEMWNIDSVLKFASKGRATAYFSPSKYLERLLNVYCIPSFKETIDTLLQGKTVRVVVHKPIQLTDFIELKQIFCQASSFVNADVDILLLHMLELGYLTYELNPKNDPNEIFVKIPNHEIKQIILKIVWKIQLSSNIKS